MSFPIYTQYAYTKFSKAVFVELPAFDRPGCASAGDTEQEAVANAKEALALWFEPRDLELENGARILEVAVP